MWILRQSLWLVRMANNFHSSLFPHLTVSKYNLICVFLLSLTRSLEQYGDSHVCILSLIDSALVLEGVIL